MYETEKVVCDVEGLQFKTTYYAKYRYELVK